MKYLQFFSDKAKYLEPYQDDERGRLLMAMIAYASDGTEPHFDGNERYIWPVFRDMIDASAKSLENKRKGGSSSQSKDDDEHEDASTSEHGEEERSKSEQRATEPSTTEQIATGRSIPEQNGTEPDIIKESRIKNQESRTKREGGKAASAARERFAPPSPADVNAYAAEIGAAQVDGERFCDFYTSKGWRVGSQPMKDWRAALRTWAKRDTASHPPDKPVKTVLEQQYSQRSYSNGNHSMDAMMAEFLAEQEGGGP